MMQKIAYFCLLAPWVLETSSFSPAARRAFKTHSRAMKMAYNTFVTVDSKFETACSLDADVGVSLSDYMQLPVDQYVCIKMPLDATLERMEGSKFNMTVPPVRFFTLDVSPTIICNVLQNDNFVSIDSSECTLRGSKYVEDLNGCYRLKIQSTFSWFDSPTKKIISSKSTIGLEVDPPAPFKYFGKSILETTGRLALSIALAEIGNAFVQALARDYEKWANSETYRVERAGGLCHLDSEEFIMTRDKATKDFAKEMARDTVGGAVGCMVLIDLKGVPVEGGQKTEKIPVLTEVSLASLTATPATPQSIPLNTAIEAESMVTPIVAEEAEIVLADVVTKNSLPVLTDDICLFPGSEPIVRVEEAPSNARRIFTGVDIMADMESIWDVLTNFERLQDVVPSLVKNEVMFLTAEGGARLAQVGGAKVLPGVTFTAKTVLDVNVYKEDNPLPDSMLALDGVNGANSADVRAFGKALPLQRGVFPRPYSLTRLPHRDITMQNVLGEGDFEHYQGVWRMQSLPNCAPNGGNASRLTYAVEIKPKGILPVKLIEGRIAADLKANMAAIRNFVEAAELKKPRPRPVLPVETAVTVAAVVAVKEVVEELVEMVEVAAEAVVALQVSQGESSKDIAIQGMITEVSGDDDKKDNFFSSISKLFLGTTEDSMGVTHSPSQAFLPLPMPTDNDAVRLIDENKRLKARVAYLEKEMEKANVVLRKIESLSKLD